MTKKKPQFKPRIVLGVTGCIAAYKAADLVRLFVKDGAEVKVILTSCAHHFVTPVTMSTLSQNPVYTDAFEPEDGWFPAHIALAQWANIMVIAPLSADTLGKIACGLADNLLLNTLLAFGGPVLLSPSMNDQMLANERVQANIQTLKQIKRYHMLAPESGFLACLSDGPGRLPDNEAIVREVRRLL